MRIVRIIGGLGNQMFQYALYLKLKKIFPNEQIYVDYSLMKSYKVHNGLEIDRVFGVELPQASFRDLIKVTRPTNSYNLSRIIEKALPPKKSELVEAKDYTLRSDFLEEGDRYYRGYWQNYKYFIDIRDEICRAYQFRLQPNEDTIKLLTHLNNDQSSVSVHVRRGDYLKAPNYAGLCGVEYYKRALKYIKDNISNPTFYLFSDDMTWCKEHIVPLFGEDKYVTVDFNRGDYSPLDMQLMSSCRHNVIANSSFSWWAAFLNTNKDASVCAPEKWTNTQVNCKFQLPEWNLF